MREKLVSPNASHACAAYDRFPFPPGVVKNREKGGVIGREGSHKITRLAANLRILAMAMAILCWCTNDPLEGLAATGRIFVVWASVEAPGIRASLFSGATAPRSFDVYHFSL